MPLLPPLLTTLHPASSQQAGVPATAGRADEHLMAARVPYLPPAADGAATRLPRQPARTRRSSSRHATLRRGKRLGCTAATCPAIESVAQSQVATRTQRQLLSARGTAPVRARVEQKVPLHLAQ